mgnify:CR=1 FL=1
MNVPNAPRTNVDLTHFSDQCSDIGRLSTIALMPVLPGDGAELNIVGSLRFSPLRRSMIKDARVDICTFFTPMRFMYDEAKWVDFIEKGYDEDVTLGIASASGAQTDALGFTRNDTTNDYPKWMVYDYPKIWNNYFRPPTQVDKIAETGTIKQILTTADRQYYGMECAHLKTMWSTTLKNELQASDYEVAVSSGKVSLIDMEKQLGFLRTEQEREYFNKRYRDIIREAGGWANYDADQRPQLIARSSFWSSGFDINGTDQASLGQHSGRMASDFMHRLPRWHVNEHGVIRTVMLVRYPSISIEEFHYLSTKAEPTYAEIAGDPNVIATQPPIALKRKDIFSSSNTTTIGFMPYGQWYRYHPSFTNQRFRAVSGFPYIHKIAGPTNMHLITPADYNAMFQTNQLRHWHCIAKINAPFMRRIPTAAQSLLTG